MPREFCVFVHFHITPSEYIGVADDGEAALNLAKAMIDNQADMPDAVDIACVENSDDDTGVAHVVKTRQS